MSELYNTHTHPTLRVQMYEPFGFLAHLLLLKHIMTATTSPHSSNVLSVPTMTLSLSPLGRCSLVFPLHSKWYIANMVIFYS